MSIDEQIVPAKTKHSGIRQYNAKKPHKWGFKNFVRAGQSGIIYDFFFYTGQKSSGSEQRCTTENVVLRLVENVPRKMNYKIFYDNWFSSLDLGLKLKDLGILTVSTIRSNRLANCQLPTDKERASKRRKRKRFLQNGCKFRDCCAEMVWQQMRSFDVHIHGRRSFRNGKKMGPNHQEPHRSPMPNNGENV